ncbi:MAG: T9SS type A sorting domain-containing protein [candidate division Zixibacteria bacterium]
MAVLVLFSDTYTYAQIELIGSCQLEDPWVLQVRDTFVYIAGRQPNLQIVDVSNPTAPYIAGILDSTADIYNISVGDEYAFLANGYSDLSIVDVRDQSDPLFVMSYECGGVVHDVVVFNNIAYVIDCYRLHILDITNMLEPILMSEILINSNDARELYIKESYAFITDYHGEAMKIVDIYDPYNPEFIVSIDDLSRTEDIFVHDNHAYIPSTEGLQIIDVSNPDEPFRVGQYDSEYAFEKIYCEGDYAYLAAGNRGVIILDISNPSNPVLIAFYASSFCKDLFVENGYIYAIISSRLDILQFLPTIINESLDPAIRIASIQIYPNPFNASTTIRYDLPNESEVRIEIYDLLGRNTKTLLAGTQPAGSHSIVWDAEDVSSGVYFYRIEAGDYNETRKCVLLK